MLDRVDLRWGGVRVSKNIVVLSDGTGQEGGEGHNTNIYRMFDMVEDRTQRQVVYYDAGVGTGWRKVTGNAFGRGFSRNIRQAYQFIFEQFEVGDRIYLIGFSRGAATVRSLSGFIFHFGILPRSRPKLIKQAFRIYRKRKKRDFGMRVDDFVRANGTMYTNIEFLGCYDTVAALGFPIKSVASLIDQIPGFGWKFHDLDLSANVNNAYQALAVDDERRTFHPKLWNYPPPNPQTQFLKQVWFVGMHTDVGGGYRSGQTLSSIPLVWLTEQAAKCGVYVRADLEPIYEDAAGVMHDSRWKPTAKLYIKKVRSWDPQRSDQPIVHQSVLDRRAHGHSPVERKPNDTVDVAYDPWILEDHPPGKYDVEPWKKVDEQDWYHAVGSPEAIE
jgi:hypothetical protein